MEKYKNTYIFKKNIVIEKKKETIVPEFGDEFFLCKGQAEIYKRVVNECMGEHIAESYSSESFDEYVTDYKLCNKLSINNKPYSFFGYKMESPDGTTKRKFFLYET